MKGIHRCAAVAIAVASVSGMYTAVGYGKVAGSLCSAKRSTFVAFHNHQQPGPENVYVAGSVTCPTTGYSVELVRAQPPGINPDTLILEVSAKPPSGRVANHVTDYPVRVDLGKVAYQDVTIRGAGPEFTLPVKPVY